jgi:hypothetical protein
VECWAEVCKHTSQNRTPRSAHYTLRSLSFTCARADPQAQQEHDDAREIYDLLNEQLIAELPQMVELRIRTYPTLHVCLHPYNF